MMFCPLPGVGIDPFDTNANSVRSILFFGGCGDFRCETCDVLLIHSFIHSFTFSFIHSFIDSFVQSISIMAADTPPTPSDAPSDANAGCVGPAAEDAGKSSACDGCPNQGACSSGSFSSPEAIAKAQQEANALQHSLSNVSHVILVLSGKGGVGKSTVAAQLSHTLASQGYAVGLLDVDLCGPSAPRMVLGDAYQTATVTKSASGAWIPVYSTTHPNLACMSISFLLQDHDSAVVWRGTKKESCVCVCSFFFNTDTTFFFTLYV
jgi:hypothetical protein